LTKTAVALFRKLHDLTGTTEFVLPGKKAGHLNSHVISTALRRCQEAESFGIASFGAHDLRRTMRTGLVRLGVSTELAERIIGHKPRNVLIQTYDLYDRIPERRKALMLWDAEVQRIVSSKSNVASIKRRRA
jgi:integrase